MLEKCDLYCGKQPLLATRIQVSYPGPNDPLVMLLLLLFFVVFVMCQYFNFSHIGKENINMF